MAPCKHARCGRWPHLPLLVVLLLPVLGLLQPGCGSSGDGGPGLYKKIEVEGGSFTDVMPQELSRMLSEAGGRILLVNVHIPYQGELAGTDLFLPYSEIEGKLDLFPKDRKARIVVYCLSGHMSAEAAQTLVRQGYKDIWNLHGGMNQWRLDGLPLEQMNR